MAGSSEGPAWIKYLRLQELGELIGSGQTRKQHRLAREILFRMELDRLTPQQLKMLESSPFSDLAFALRRWADEPVDCMALLDDIGSPASVAMAGPRFFGFVIGGSMPVTVAANWLATAWDQNSVMSAITPAVAALENVSRRWLCELLGLPQGCAAKNGKPIDAVHCRDNKAVENNFANGPTLGNPSDEQSHECGPCDARSSPR